MSANGSARVGNLRKRPQSVKKRNYDDGIARSKKRRIALLKKKSAKNFIGGML